MKETILLDDFQKKAIEYGLKGYSVIVSAPTGAGKTLIAEHIIDACLKDNKGVIYTAPIKALSNQKFRDFSKKYTNKVGIVTGDVSINPDAPLIIMTTEIFRNAILTSPARFNNKMWVIFDEIHYLDDIERGTVWEETIILLPKHMHLLALSATLPNIDEFIQWLKSVHTHPIKKVVEKKRPVPLTFRYQCNDNFFFTYKELKRSKSLSKHYSNNNYHIKPNKLSSLVVHLKSKNLLPCIYFSFSRRRCEILAHQMHGFNLLESKEKDRVVELFSKLTETFDVTDTTHINFLYPLIKKGIGYHHAGLLPPLKEIIERLFTTGLLKLIFTTETFALGINMPAKTVVFDTLYKYYGRTSRYLKVRDFYQMAGRAGRRGIDSKGFVYIRVDPARIDTNKLENIIYGEYEPIVSQLRSCYATILNLYNIMQEKLYDIYPRSFLFKQTNYFKKKEALNLLKRKVALLKEMKYIVNGGISWKAELASRVYSFELQVGELYEKGIFDSLDELSFFVVICALVYEPRKGEKRPKLTKKTKRLKKEFKYFMKGIHKVERRFHIYPLSKSFSFNLAEASCAWYEGISFYKLNKLCATDEGEIVRYFRMAIQVLREMSLSPTITSSLKSRVYRCLKRVNRDVINAENQLTTDINLPISP